jgi:c-di-GMP-binding flagellar brake protein YcgR
MTRQAPSGDARDQTAILRDACERNIPLDLQYRSSEDELFVARARMLAMDDHHIYLDEPQSIGRPVRFVSGLAVEAYILLKDVRYGFDTVVVETRRTIRLNDQKRVAGIVLRRPGSVRQRQRRNEFRVGLLREGPIPVDLHAALPDGTSPLDAVRCSGTLLDLSPGGLAVRLDPAAARGIAVNDHLFLVFELPCAPPPLRFLGEVRQRREVADGDVVRLGVRFRPWPSSPEFRRSQTRLQRYAANMQRKRLRRSG